MFDKFNPFNIESKGNIMIEIKGEMDAQGAKEVSQTVAEGKRFFIKCAGVALILCVVGYFVLRFIQAAWKGVEKMEKLSAWRFIVISFLIGMALVLWRLPEIIALLK